MIQLEGYELHLLQKTLEHSMDYYERMNRPSYIFKPSLTIDGNQWCALFGESLQDGIAGFGDTPELAYEDFDHNWKTYKVKREGEV